MIELWRRCGLLVPWNDPDRDIDRKLAVDPDGLLVVDRHGQVVATAMCGYEGHRAWLNYLAVDPDLQGSGLGRMLVAHLEERMRARGCAKLQLLVRSHNRDARAFYERLGYRCDDAVPMGKRLVVDA